MQLFTKKSITALLANQMIEAATKKAQEIGFSIAITIVET